MKTSSPTRSEAGQVLPITALFMVVLLLFAALAVDVTGVLAAERFYTTTADAAALAGAQDLQKGKKRTVTSDEYAAARQHAMKVLVDELDASGTPFGVGCDPASDIVSCTLPDTPYLVSAETPVSYCVEPCDPNRSVKVTIRNPDHDMSFARLVGQPTWNIESSAVAGLQFSGKYALIALKPVDSNFQDGIVGNGTGTIVEVLEGDIGTNTNAELSGGAEFRLSDGYYIRYLDDSVGTQWGPTPPGVLNPSEIRDPQPPVPSFLGATVFAEQAEGEIACPADVTSLDTVPDDVVCYAPGVYEAKKNNDRFEVSNKGAVKAYLTSGVYKFEGGLNVDGELYGGLVADQPGVTIYIPSDQELDANDADVMRLNTNAGPAVDWSGETMENDDGLLVTIYVPRLDVCFSDAVPIECKDEDKDEPDIKLAGDSALYIKGVIYAPSKGIAVRGGSDSNAIDGQIVGWTLEWSGGSTLHLNYPDFEQVGLLRLNAACTGVEACS